MQLILGSASPRRRELIARLGVAVADTRAPNIDETPLKGELPRPYCARMAQEKLAVLPCAVDEVVLCADTTVAVGRRILGKPADQAEAEAFLRLLSGRRHRVITAVAVKTAQQSWLRVVQSSVKFRVLSDADITWYLDSGEWDGKAGGYAIQGLAEAFIPWIEGSYSAIMGLPLAQTAGVLQAAGLRLGQQQGA